MLHVGYTCMFGLWQRSVLLEENACVLAVACAPSVYLTVYRACVPLYLRPYLLYPMPNGAHRGSCSSPTVLVLSNGSTSTTLLSPCSSVLFNYATQTDRCHRRRGAVLSACSRLCPPTSPPTLRACSVRLRSRSYMMRLPATATLKLA